MHTLPHFYQTIGGSVLLFFSLRRVYRWWHSRSWAQVHGIVTTCRVERYRESGETGDTYTIEIRYHYRVGAREYIGCQIENGSQIYATLQKAEAQARAYPTGSQVVVRYDPARPGDALLQTRLERMTWVLVLIALSLILDGWFQR